MTRQSKSGLIERALPVLLLAGIAFLALVLVKVPRDTVQGSIAPAEPWLELAPATVIERFAFASCADQRRPQPIWSKALEARPQLLLMMGDNVYGDIKDASARQLRNAYATLARHPDFAKIRLAVPILATWDDHDYGRNDAGGDFPFKRITRRLFDDFWRSDEARRARPGVWDARIYGPPGRRVQIILLDTRSFRSPWPRRPPTVSWRGPYGPDASVAPTMLGAEQWAWLEGELRKPAELRFIVSSVQVLAEHHGFERWGHFPRERERLTALIGATKANGVVLLSGDRHFGALYRTPGTAAYPLVEATASAINLPMLPHHTIEEGGVERIGEGYRQENFGMAAIDWRARRLTLSLIGMDGKAVRQLEVGFSDLGLP